MEKHKSMSHTFEDHEHSTKPIAHSDAVTKVTKWFKIHVHMSEEHTPTTTFGKIQHAVGSFIESRPVQYFLILLLIVDILLLLTDLTIEAAFNHKPPQWVHTFEAILFWLTLSMLCIFELELLLLFFAFTWKFFFHPMYVIDFVFVTGAIILEIIFRDTLMSVIPTFLRMWRIIRIAQTVALAESEFFQKESHEYKEKLHKLEAKLMSIQIENDYLKKK